MNNIVQFFYRHRVLVVHGKSQFDFQHTVEVVKSDGVVPRKDIANLAPIADIHPQFASIYLSFSYILFWLVSFVSDGAEATLELSRSHPKLELLNKIRIFVATDSKQLLHLQRWVNYVVIK